MLILDLSAVCLSINQLLKLRENVDNFSIGL